MSNKTRSFGLAIALLMATPLLGCAGSMATSPPSETTWRWAEREQAFAKPDSVSFVVRSATSIFTMHSALGDREVLSPLRGTLRSELEAKDVDVRQQETGTPHAEVTVVDWTPANQQTMSSMIVLRTRVVVSNEGRVLFAGELVGPPQAVGRSIAQMLSNGGKQT